MIRYLLLTFVVLAMGCASLPKEKTEPQELRTPSGFPYIHHIRNEGPKPQPGDYAFFHVIMTRSDTVLFDSKDQPQMPMLQIPPADQRPSQPSPILEGLALMAVGDSMTVQFPLDSATTMIYHFALKQISSAEDYRLEQHAQRMARDTEVREILEEKEEKAALDTRFLWKQFRTGQLGTRLVHKPSGLEYVLLEDGLGKIPEPGQWVWVHLLGILQRDGKEVLNTFDQARKFAVQAGQGQAPPGLEEVIATMKTGARLVLFLPSQLAYGEKGYLNIPPNADLVLYVEITDVE